MKLPKKFVFNIPNRKVYYFATYNDETSMYSVIWDGMNMDYPVKYSAVNVQQWIEDGEWIIASSSLLSQPLQKFDRVILKDDTNRVYIFQSEENGCNVLIDVVAGSSCAMSTVLLEQLLFTVHAAPETVVDVLDIDIKGVLKYESDLAKSLNLLLDQRNEILGKLTGLQTALTSVDEQIEEITK